MSDISGQAYEGYQVYFGDIHNHCNLSYGHGTLNDALRNARLQLDFVSVTVHAVWPDLPTDDPAIAYLVDYHEQGFEKARANWPSYLETVEQANSEGDFVTFPSFEWHSIKHGDYCVYYNCASQDLPIVAAHDLESLRSTLRSIDCPSLVIPHHIGYRQGSRGINWNTYTEELSPFAEIFSFHGSSESSEGPYPYLHSMGPRHEQSSAQYGWSQGKLFGVVGSTDHHNAFPGSYGFGRMAVWAESLSRDAIWQALRNRRTYALTGDNIALRFQLNGQPIGSVCPPDDTRTMEVSITAGDSIDYVEVVYNNHVVHRENVLEQSQASGRFKIYFEMGWGEQDYAFDWDSTIAIEGGKLLDVEPRFRGKYPTANVSEDIFNYTSLDTGENQIHIETKTWPNPSLHSSGTEGVAFEIEGTPATCICLNVNGHEERVCLSDIMTGSRTFYTGGFVSPAYCLHRAVPQAEYQREFVFEHHNRTSERDWYYVRVRQRNNQWAWSSPIWVEGNID